MRDALGLRPGDTLDLKADGEQITLRLVRHGGPLRQEQGIWVYRSGKPLPVGLVEKTLRKLRRERESRLAAERELQSAAPRPARAHSPQQSGE